MNTKQIRYVLIGALAVGSLAYLAIMFFGLSVLGSKSQELSKLRLQSRVTDDQIASLAQSKAEVSKYSYFKDVSKSVIPTDKDQAQAVVDIFKIADESGISLENLTFPASTLGAGAALSATSSTATTPASSSSTTKTILSQATPVAGIPGLYSIQVTITPESGQKVSPDKQVTYTKLLDFLHRIENNRRTAQITAVNIQPIAGSDYVNFSLTINIFIKP